ncbi:hypothetical protein F3Y22_tig00111543pilonHSYRG00141 [Hibiscus syriacus]|uniref:DNA (Cytosine-5)-methyltransferase DRM1/2 n=1 Tax=Hibiscus syriacus TaxID=106335 RepID=A0A6A2XNM1_HIBSY|nr:hypothetical protein F3Y22_tig00111543pilonHSYRG00141 [Hibiscus syriacus]
MQHVDSNNYSSDYEAIFQDDFTDIDSSSDTEEILNSDSDEEKQLLFLTKMGCSEAEASITMEKYGLDSSIAELTDFICTAQMAKAADALLPKYVLNECRKWDLVWVGRNKVVPLKPDEVEILLEVAFYCLGIPLKTDVQELNSDRLEQLMRCGEFDHVVGGIPFQQSFEGHNGYNLDKENDRHGRSNNDVSRLEIVSQYNQSAEGGLVHSHNTPNETYNSVIEESARNMD